MPPAIKFIVKVVVFAIILPAGLLVGGAWAFLAYETHPIKSFCKGVGRSDTSQAIIDRSKAVGLFYAVWQGTDDIWILNRPLEAAPMFRFACVVTFKGGKVSGTSLIDAD